MATRLPDFRYHPDPLATGSIVPSDSSCECCGRARGYLYKAPIFCKDEVQDICPWCIASGEAATKFDAHFSDDHPLIEAGISASVINEVTRRTPGVFSWQQERWQAHCNDACEFHGDASLPELQNLSGVALTNLLQSRNLDRKYWRQVLRHYEPGGSPSVYKYVCRHCNEAIYTMDFA